MTHGNNKFISNPFVLYGVTWLCVILVYQLEWSYLPPKLTTGYILFFAITISISFLFGLITHKRKIFIYRPLTVIDFRIAKKFLYILWGMFLFEIIAARDIPLLSYILGNREKEYTDFGLAFIHVLVVNGFTILILYSYYGYRSMNDRQIKRKCIKYLLFSALPFALMFNRGGLMFGVLGCLIIYLMSTRNVAKVLIKIMTLIIGILFIFGALGNLRTDVAGAKNLLLEFGEAKESFKESWIPSEFFWSYIYIATPLANAQLMVDKGENIEPTASSYRDFICFELMPEIIAKRISSETMHRQEKDLIFPAFNVCSVYGRTYKYLGWWGPIFMFSFSIFFIIVTVGLIPKKSPFYVLGVTEVCIITIMNLFDNMYVFMGLIPQPFILILLSHFYRNHGK